MENRRRKPDGGSKAVILKKSEAVWRFASFKATA
jgi:hypothetical protein